MSRVSLSGNGRWGLGSSGYLPGDGEFYPSTGLARRLFASDIIRNGPQRAGAAALVVILHAAVITLVLLLSRARAPLEQASGLITFDVAAGQDRARISHPAHPHQAAAPASATPLPLPVIYPPSIAPVQPSPMAAPELVIQAASFTAGAGCDLTQSVQDGLRRNVALKSLLAGIPDDRRSIANAIAMWHAGWINPGAASAQSAFAAVRQTITQKVLAANADCRSQPQFGPRLLYLPASVDAAADHPGKTIVLALGSGLWNWQQLIDGDQPLPTDTAEALVAPPPLTRLATLQQAAPPDPSPAMNAMLASLIHQQTPAGLPYYP